MSYGPSLAANLRHVAMYVDSAAEPGFWARVKAPGDRPDSRLGAGRTNVLFAPLSGRLRSGGGRRDLQAVHRVDRLIVARRGDLEDLDVLRPTGHRVRQPRGDDVAVARLQLVLAVAVVVEAHPALEDVEIGRAHV